MCIFGYFRLGAYIFIDKEQRISIINSIKSASPLPSRLYELCEVANPQSLNTGYTENNARQLIDAVLGERNYRVKEVPSASATYISTYSWGIEKIQLIYYIEDHTSQKECLNFIAEHFDFLYGNIGIETASQFYLEEKFEKLDDREMMTLIVMMENPSLYSPVRRPNILKETVDHIMERMEE